MIKNLAELKKSLVRDSQYQVIEHAFKPYHNGQIRVVTEVHTHSISAKNITDTNCKTSLHWQKAKNMRFNEDESIDFLLGEEMNDQWLLDQQKEQGKDYWMRIRTL